MQLAEQLYAIIEQYDNEDFDLGIKQFMIEQAIQQVHTHTHTRARTRTHIQAYSSDGGHTCSATGCRYAWRSQAAQWCACLSFVCVGGWVWLCVCVSQDLEDGGGKGADNKDFEEKLAEALFADEGTCTHTYTHTHTHTHTHIQ